MDRTMALREKNRYFLPECSLQYTGTAQAAEQQNTLTPVQHHEIQRITGVLRSKDDL
jgi:hypothetical protein